MECQFSSTHRLTTYLLDISDKRSSRWARTHLSSLVRRSHRHDNSDTARRHWYESTQLNIDSVSSYACMAFGKGADSPPLLTLASPSRSVPLKEDSTHITIRRGAFDRAAGNHCIVPSSS